MWKSNVGCAVLEQRTHILASALFPLDTTSATNTNASVAYANIQFKLSLKHTCCFQRRYFTWPKLLKIRNSAKNIAFSTKPQKITPPVQRKVQTQLKQYKPIPKWMPRTLLQCILQTISQTSPITAYTPHIVWGSVMKLWPEHEIEKTHRIEREKRPVSKGEKTPIRSLYLDMNTCRHRLRVELQNVIFFAQSVKTKFYSKKSTLMATNSTIKLLSNFF